MIFADPTAPHTPWHEKTGLTAADMAANLAAARDEFAALTSREKNSAIWSDSFAAHRDAGFTPGRILKRTDGTTYEINAAQVAAIEARTAPRFRAEPKAPAPDPSRTPAAKFTLALDGDRIRWISDNIPASVSAWHDPEAPQIAGDALDIHDDISFRRAEIIQQAEMDFARDVTEETGAAVSPEQYAKMQKNRAKLRDMTNQLAARLASSGIMSHRADAAKAYAYWVHTGHLEELPAYRRICILPGVAASMRAPKLAALEFWLDRNEYARFWTFTTGERCPLRGPDGLEVRLKWLSRKISKLNHGLRAYGVEMVFRSTEFGGLEKKTHTAAARMEGGGLDWAEDGSPLFHPHAHCVVVAHFGYNPSRWQAATQFARSFWTRNGRRLHCDFGEIIGNARECCKYVTKPGDLLKLSADDLKTLFEITYRAKLCHPLGSLAREIRVREGFTATIEKTGVIAHRAAELDADLDDDGAVPDSAFVGNRQARTLRELAAKHGVPLAALVQQNPGIPADPDTRLDYGTRIIIFPGGRCLRRVRQGRRMVWVERLDHNKTGRETPDEKAQRESLEDAYAATEECRRLSAQEPIYTNPWEAVTSPDFIGPFPHVLTRAWQDTEARSTRSARIGCPTRVVARLMPAAGPTRIKEPRVIVMSMDGRAPDLAHVRAHPLVMSLWSETVEAWEAGSALDRYSVHTGTPTVHDPDAEAPPDPADAHFRAEREAFNASAAFAQGINF